MLQLPAGAKIHLEGEACVLLRPDPGLALWQVTTFLHHPGLLTPRLPHQPGVSSILKVRHHLQKTAGHRQTLCSLPGRV